MKRILLSLGIFSLALLSIQAQVITWSVKPGVYSKIEPCWGDLYYVYNSNGIGIINGDGEVLVSPKASRITGFYGGLALVLKADGGKIELNKVIEAYFSGEKILPTKKSSAKTSSKS